MTLDEVFTKIRGFDETLENRVVPSLQVTPQGANRILVDGEELTWSEAAANQLRQQLSVPEDLENRLPADMAPLIWRALIEREAAQPLKRKRITDHLKVTICDGQVVGFSDPSLVTLSNSQVIEALEAATGRLPMHEAQVAYSGELQADAWHLKVIFPFKQTEPRANDVVHGGLSVKFSAVGLHPIQVRNWLHRLWCSNGSGVPICENAKQLRIRRRRDKQSADQEVIKRIQETVEQGVRELDGKLAAVKALTKKPVDARRMVTQIAQQTRLRRSVAEALLKALDEDESGKLQGKGTRYDVWNAISRVASQGAEDIVRPAIRERLSMYSGVFSQADVHMCPTCQRILEPSQN